MSLKRTVEPTELPLTLDEVKAFLHVTGTADDAEIMAYLRAAVRQLDGPEGLLNRAIVTQTLVYSLDCFPPHHDAFDLPLPPLQSVSAVAYIDTAGVTQTWDSANYRVLNAATPTRKGRIELAYGISWPSTRDIGQAVSVTYVAGYGARNDVPDGVQTLVNMMVKEIYDHRDPLMDGSSRPSASFMRLLNLARFESVA